MSGLQKVNLGTPPTAVDGDTSRDANTKANANVDVLNSQATLTSNAAVITVAQALTVAHVGKRVNINLAAAGTINLPVASTCAIDNVIHLRNVGATLVTLAITAGSGDTLVPTTLAPGESAHMDTDGVHAWNLLTHGVAGNSASARANLGVGSVLLASVVTTAAQGPIPFDGLFTSEFHSYEVVLSGIKATAAANFVFQFRRAGANAPVATAGYAYANQLWTASTGFVASNNDSTIVLVPSANTPLLSSGISGVLDIMAPQDAVTNKSVTGQLFGSGAANFTVAIGGRFFNDTLAVDGFQLGMLGSGFIAGGIIKVYGRRA